MFAVTAGGKGKPGSAWRQTTGAPDNSVGADGDWAYDPASGAIYQKANGAYTLASLLQVSQFVSASTMTVAQVLSNFPAGSAYVGKYARVSDLYGGTDEVLRCCLTDSMYYWRPQRTDFGANMTNTGGALSLLPFVHAPQMRLTGTLLSNMMISPSPTNAWPGCTFEVTSAGILGLFGITLAGLIGSNVSLLTGATRRLIYTTSGWYSQ